MTNCPPVIRIWTIRGTCSSLRYFDSVAGMKVSPTGGKVPKRGSIYANECAGVAIHATKTLRRSSFILIAFKHYISRNSVFPVPAPDLKQSYHFRFPTSFTVVGTPQRSRKSGLIMRERERCPESRTMQLQDPLSHHRQVRAPLRACTYNWEGAPYIC